MDFSFHRVVNQSSVAVVLILLIGLTGCAHPAQLGNRAYKQQNYSEALRYYKKAIKEGNTDPSVLHNAAQVAVEEGEFTLAERYFTKALRQGGGPDIAKDLANFYIKTSNYVSAVRVYQYLLETDLPAEPIYNNLGMALIYADRPLDAESYLLMAQNEDPTDPVPYLNLGLLYDKHLHREALAMGFYKCFNSLSDNNRQLKKVRARLRQLRRDRGRNADSAYGVKCGDKYTPANTTKQTGSSSLARMKKRIERAQQSSRGTKKDPIQLNFSENTSSNPKKQISPEVSRRLEKIEGSTRNKGDSRPTGASEQAASPAPQSSDQTDAKTGDRDSSRDQSSGDAPNQSPDDKVYRKARKAFEAGDHQKVVDQISAIPLNRLSPDTMTLYGKSLLELGQVKKASQWLEWAFREDPSYHLFDALLQTYNRLDNTAKLKQYCKRYRKQYGDKPTPEACNETNK